MAKIRMNLESIGHALTTSTTRAARRPNKEPAGPDSARNGTKMADARLPMMPEPK